MADIDSLQIQIEASSADAVKRLDDLTAALKRLQTQVNQKYNNPVAGIGHSDGATSGGTRKTQGSEQPKTQEPVIEPQVTGNIEEAEDKVRRLKDLQDSLRENVKLNIDSTDADAATKKVSALSKLLKSIGRIAMYRAIRSAMKEVTDSFKTGIENLYQFSRGAGSEFAASMDKIATSSLYVKNSLGAMVAPILNSLAPAIDWLADKFVMLLNVINQLFSALSGKTTYTKAIKYPVEYAEAANDAADAAKRFTLGIDELNIISDQSSGSGGASTDYSSMFEEDVPINSTIQTVAEKIKELLPVIEAVGAAFLAWKVSSTLLSGIEGLAEKLKGLDGGEKSFSLSFSAVGLAGFLTDIDKFMDFFDDFQKNGPTFNNVVGMISEFVGAIGDIALIAGNLKFGGFLKLIQGIGEIIVGIKKIYEEGVNWDNANLVIQGITNIGIAIGAMTGNWKLAGVSLAIQGLSTIITEIGKNWEAIKNGDWSGVDKSKLVIGAIEAITGIATALGVLEKIKGIFSASKATESVTEVATDSKSLLKIPSPTSILKGVADLALIIGGVVVIVETLGMIAQIPGFEENTKRGIDALKTVFGGIADILIPLASVSALTVIFGKVGAKTIAAGFADLALIIVGTTAIITAIGALIGLPGFDEAKDRGIAAVQDVFNGIADIGLSITLLSAGIAALGVIGIGTITSGFLGFAEIIAGTTVIITAVGALMSIPYMSDFLSTGIASIQDVFSGLSNVGLEIGVFSALIVGLGFATPAIITSGLLGFVEIVGAFEALLVALGALNQIPGFSWLVDEGGKALIKLGETLGSFVGAIVEGLLTQVSEGLPTIADNLSKFAENLVPFLEVMSGVDSGIAEATKNLASAILQLTAANLLDAITSFITGGKSLADFGEQIAAFGPKFAEYADSVSGIDPDVVTASSNAAQSLTALAKDIPSSGGLWQMLAGGKDIESFGEQLVAFGKSFKQYSDQVDGINPDVVTASASAAQALVELAQEIPTSGGLWQLIAGKQDIGEFGESLVSFGTYFREYADSVAGISTDVVTASASAAQSLVALAGEIPTSGGLWQILTGKQDMASFGESLAGFGDYFKQYYDYIKGISAGKVTSTAEALGSIIDLAERTKDVDTAKLKSFGDAIQYLGEKLSGTAWQTVGSDFSTGISNMVSSLEKGEASMKSSIEGLVASLSSAWKSISTDTTNTWSQINTAVSNAIEQMQETVSSSFTSVNDALTTYQKTTATAKTSTQDFTRTAIGLYQNMASNCTASIQSIINKLNAIPTKISTTVTITGKTSGSSVLKAISSAKAFATGGYPDEGQMFIAREAGPELVGQIGNRTAVANNDQIVEGVSAGVENANQELISVVYAVAQQLVSAIQSSGGNVYLDGRKVSAATTSAQNRQNIMYGKTLQNA